MNCRDFEIELDALGESDPGAGATRRLEAHAARCADCAELLELSRLPAVPPDSEPGGIAREVLGRTSGSVCHRAEEHLADFADGVLPAGMEQRLLTEHIAHCEACAGLVAELERLTADLPRLSTLRPDPSLVEGVLRRTLPVPVLLRRWWAATWPQWIRRPRFATELAYLATVLVVVVFGVPVSPLQAMSERAVELVRKQPLENLEVLPATTRQEIASRFDAVVEKGHRGARSLTSDARTRAGTILEEVASWFESADDDQPADDTEIEEETS